MPVEEFEDALLYGLAATVGNVPQLGLQLVAGTLAVPSVVYNLEGLLHASHGEELVLRAVDEEHRLRTGQAGYVRIVQPTAQTRETVGKAAVLRAAVLETHLLVSGHHPANGSPHLDAVAQCREHPRPIAAHRPSRTANA